MCIKFSHNNSLLLFGIYVTKSSGELSVRVCRFSYSRLCFIYMFYKNFLCYQGLRLQIFETNSYFIALLIVNQLFCIPLVSSFSYDHNVTTGLWLA